jgi:hypothetical protein
LAFLSLHFYYYSPGSCCPRGLALPQNAIWVTRLPLMSPRTQERHSHTHIPTSKRAAIVKLQKTNACFVVDCSSCCLATL